MRGQIMRKKILLFILSLLVIMGCCGAVKTSALASDETTIKTSDGSSTIKYRNSNTEVTIPTTYVTPTTEFRATWVSYLIGSLKYVNENQFKGAVQDMLDMLEYYNINVVIYHVRTHNQAYYNSSFNKIASDMEDVDWDEFDPMEYVVTETHKRGMEFHAWLNPYRIASTSSYATKEDLAKEYEGLEGNATSNPDNILKANSYYQLDPGRPEVRTFLVNTCMEIIEKYDVDAIHFDDYFYFEGPEDYDLETRKLYNTSNLSIDDFRRAQNDAFIYELSSAMKTYNKENNRYVQLGISPSGIYRNGSYTKTYTYDADGNLTSPVGSNTSGFAHYGSYLYADTKKWIDNGWIDYILPQSYWALGHTVAGFADVMTWWNAVVKYKKCNLYSGMGLYMANTSGKNYTWSNNPDEALNQMKYITKLDYCKGVSIYSYNTMKTAYNNPDSIENKNLSQVRETCWKYIGILPEVPSLGDVKALQTTDALVAASSSGMTLSWTNVEGGKFYYIYRSNNNKLTWSDSEIIKVVYADQDLLTYTDTDGSASSIYGIRTYSKTGQLSDGMICSSSDKKVVQFISDGQVVSTQLVEVGKGAETPENPTKVGYTFTGWDVDYSNITKNLIVTAQYVINKYKVKFMVDGEAYQEVEVDYGTEAKVDTPTKEGYSFNGWSEDVSFVSHDMTVDATWTVGRYTVIYYDGTKVLGRTYVDYGNEALKPKNPTKSGYLFVGWSEDVSFIRCDLKVYALWAKENCVVTFMVDDTVYETVEVTGGNSATVQDPTKEGYTFMGWDQDTTEVLDDMTVNALFEQSSFTVTFMVDGEVYDTQTVNKGAAAVAPKDPSKKGYTFSGWDQDFSNITSDLTVNATFTEKKSGCSLFGMSTVLLILGSVAIVGLCAFRRKKEIK